MMMNWLSKLFVVIAFTGSLLMASSAHAGLLAHWPLDETTQPSAAESIGSAAADAALQRDMSGEGSNDHRATVNHAGVVGTSYHFGTGKTGQLDFQGSHLLNDVNADADADNFHGVTGAGERTYSIWLKYDSTVDAGITNPRQDFTLFSHGGGGAPSNAFKPQKWVIRLETESSLTLPDSTAVSTVVGALRLEPIHSRGDRAGLNNNFVTGSTVLTDEQWHHAVVTLSGGNDLTDNVFLYVDGDAEVESAEHDDNGAIDTAGNVKLAIGIDHYGHRFFPGFVDDPAIWDEGLTTGEIAVLHDAALSSYDYNASQFNSLKEAHDNGTDVMVNGTQWWYSTSVNTGEGAGMNTSGQFVFDAASGTGLVVPEPGTLVLLLMGGLGLAICGRRR